MLASHCSEIGTRWSYEYGILNFARRWPQKWSTANEQRKQVRCLQKVTRWHPNHTRRQHEDVNFYSSLYPQDTRWLHDVVLRVRCVRTRSRRRHVTSRWYKIIRDGSRKKIRKKITQKQRLYMIKIVNDIFRLCSFSVLYPYFTRYFNFYVKADVYSFI